MSKIIIVGKTGNLKVITTKKETELYKECGFKKPNGFKHQCDLRVKENIVIQVFAKSEGGRSISINKYEFPPPIDKHLFYGSVAIIAKNELDNIIDLTLDKWKVYYSKLFGGFKDLEFGSREDDDEMDELSSVQNKYKTIEGYLKDGFVVDDNEEDDRMDKELCEEDIYDYDYI